MCSQEPTFSSFFFMLGVIFDFDWSAVRHVRPRKNRTRPSACCLFRTCQSGVGPVPCPVFRVPSWEQEGVRDERIMSARQSRRDGACEKCIIMPPANRHERERERLRLCQSSSSSIRVSIEGTWLTWPGLQQGIPGNWLEGSYFY